MLEITVYKIMHAHESEARKLIPHIQGSDVFSIEMAALSKQESLQTANSWAETLQDPGMNRTRARQKISQKFNSSKLSSGDSEISYWLSVFDYLYRNNVGVWLAEQYETREEGRAMNSNIVRMIRETDRGFDLINRGMQAGKALVYSTDKEWGVINDRRDRTIGAVAQEAEQRIRESYPWLSQKPTIKWGIPIGAWHQPECYIPGASVVDLSPPESEVISLARLLRTKIGEGVSLEGVSDIIDQLAQARLRH